MNRFMRGALFAGVGGATGFLASGVFLDEIIHSPEEMQQIYQDAEHHIEACAAAISGLSTEVTALPEPCRDEEFPREVTHVEVSRFDPHQAYSSVVDTKSTTVYHVDAEKYVASEQAALDSLRTGNGGMRTVGEILYAGIGALAGLTIDGQFRRRYTPDVVEDGAESV